MLRLLLRREVYNLKILVNEVKIYYYFVLSAENTAPVYNDWCSLRNLSRILFLPNRFDSVWKHAALSICGTLLCPYVLLPVNLYCVCRGILFPLFYGHNFSLARSDSCFFAFSPFLCTAGNTTVCLLLRLENGSRNN